LVNFKNHIIENAKSFANDPLRGEMNYSYHRQQNTWYIWTSLDGVSIIYVVRFEEIKITIGKTKEQAEAFMIHNDKNDVTIMTPSISLLGKKNWNLR
jgi:hypothetical protein